MKEGSTQKEVYEDLMEMASKVLDGFYGKDNEFNVDEWHEDMDDLNWSII